MGLLRIGYELKNAMHIKADADSLAPKTPHVIEEWGWCEGCHTYELTTSGPMCGECWHQFESEKDIYDTFKARHGKRPETISSCPICGHDF